MSKPMIRIHNVQTDEIIDREMTDAEYARHKADLDAFNAKQKEIENKALAKTALLEKLGITEEEAKLLLA